MVSRSWWVKLRRAEKHLGEFNREVRRLKRHQRAYGVTTEVQTENQGDWLIARAWLRPYRGNRLAAVVGDVIFNTRCAMDHIYVVLSGNPRGQYPIFTRDIRQPDLDAAGQDRSPSRLNRFTKDTQGMPSGAVTLIESLHPYVRYPQVPESDPLAILNDLSNADKHRELVVVGNSLCGTDCHATFNGIEVANYFAPPPQATDGAIVGVFPVPPPDAEVSVKASGGIKVHLQQPGGIVPATVPWKFTLPESLVNLVTYVKDAVITPLDGFIP